jgi:hypothetical protein
MNPLKLIICDKFRLAYVLEHIIFARLSTYDSVYILIDTPADFGQEP